VSPQSIRQESSGTSKLGIIVRMITLQPDRLGRKAMHYLFWPVYFTQMCILVPRLISVKCGAF
jgi:hypothetical protein